MEDFFVFFPPEENPELEALLERHSKILRLPARKIFVRPGDPVETILCVKSGRTRHYNVSPEGEEKVVYILSRGWFLRESTFLVEHKVASRFSMAETDAELYEIDRAGYGELSRHPEFLKGLLKSSSIKNEILRRRSEGIAFDSGKARLLKLLRSLGDRSRIADGHWMPLSIQYTQAEMASILGVTRVSVSRFMTELVSEGKLRTLNRRIQINCDGEPSR